ncbi:hypothetical protein E4U35_004496 [Claviceps purpurea]|nr:hypothetical protein E4U35_004496 [Claviceps purpurea]
MADSAFSVPQQYHSDIWASPRFNGDAFMEQAMLSQVHWMLIALQQLPQAAVFRDTDARRDINPAISNNMTRPVI